MNIPHTRVEGGVEMPCVGNMVDIGTLSSPDRWLCVKCRAVRRSNEGANHIEVEPIATIKVGASPGLLARLKAWLLG